IRLAKNFPSQPIIHSTIDRMKQEKVENLAYNYIQRIHYTNITNCAVWVLNNETGNAEVYLGSADFYNAEDRGQVDGVRAIRSPGSTLKPFLYAIAFDRGLTTPKSVLTDVPANFFGYAPENFDKKFHGSVTVETALANSLNVPAVKMLDELGVPQFISQLKTAGFSSVVKNENKLGLSVVLGGCGVSLEELVRLYSSFSNEGKEIKIFYVQDENVPRKTPPELKKLRRISSAEKSDSSHSANSVSLKKINSSGIAGSIGGEQVSLTQGGKLRPVPIFSGDAIPLFTPASAFMITTILTQHTRPDLPNNYESSMRLPK